MCPLCVNLPSLRRRQADGWWPTTADRKSQTADCRLENRAPNRDFRSAEWRLETADCRLEHCSPKGLWEVSLQTGDWRLEGWSPRDWEVSLQTGDWRLETGGLVPKGLGGDSAEWKERGVKIEILDWRLEISRIEGKNLWQHHSRGEGLLLSVYFLRKMAVHFFS